MVTPKPNLLEDQGAIIFNNAIKSLIEFETGTLELDYSTDNTIQFIERKNLHLNK